MLMPSILPSLSSSIRPSFIPECFITESTTTSLALDHDNSHAEHEYSAVTNDCDKERGRFAWQQLELPSP